MSFRPLYWKNFESPPSLRSLASLTVPRRRQVQSSPSLLTHVVTLPRRPKSENSPYDWSVGGDAKVGCKQNLALGYRKSRIAISKVYRSFTAKKFLPRRVTTFPLGWPNTTYTLLLGWHLISNKFLLHQKNFCLSLRMKYRLYNFSENSLHYYHLNFHFKKNILSSFKITMMLTLCEMRFFPLDKWSWYEPHFIIKQTFSTTHKTGSNEPCPVFKKRPSNPLTDT